MLKRKKSHKITKCEVLTKKGPITLKIYREDGSDEVISNLKVSDLHLGEWREVIQACPDKSEKGWKTIYDRVKTRLDQLTQTEQELKIDLNKPLKEQDHLNELNELANNKRTSDLKDHSSLCSGTKTKEGPWLELQFSLVDKSKLNVGHFGIIKICDFSHITPKRHKASDYDNSGPAPQLQKTSDHNHSELGIHDHGNEPSSSKLVLNISPPADKTDSSQQVLDFLFSPLFEEYFTIGNQSVIKYSAISDNSQQQDTQPTANVQPTTEPVTLTTTVRVEENNDNQAAEAYHPLEQVHGNPSNPVQTRRQLSTDPEMCMFLLTVSTTEPKNIKEAMVDHAWIEEMQEELHQFDRLKVWELVDKPFGKTVIKLKWLWKNKKYEDNIVIRNKARLVAKGTSDAPIPMSSQAVNKSPTHYPCDSARTFRVILFTIYGDEWKSFQCHHQTALRGSNTLSWKSCQEGSSKLNLSDHRYQDYQDKDYQGRLLASFQDDAKYEHVGQDTRSQGGKDLKEKDLKISELTTKSKDNDERLKIKDHTA
ncbi:hypothetical protein Tco_1448029 [Tanacetum coccineum]